MKAFAFFIATSLCISLAQATSNVEASVNRNDKWVFSAFNLSSVDGAAAQDGGASVFMFNYLTAHYRIDYESKFNFRLPFIYSSAGFDTFNGDENQSQQLRLHDVAIDYTRYTLGLLPGDIEVFWQFRTKLPTSEASRAQKKIAEFENSFIMSRQLAPRWALEYWPRFAWHAQTQTAYVNNLGGVSNTRRFELEHRLTIWHRPHKDVSVGWFVAGQDSWYYRSSVNNTSRMRFNRLNEHAILTGPALSYSPTSRLRFLANISNSINAWGFSADRTGNMSDLGTFHPTETQFTLLTFLSL